MEQKSDKKVKTSLKTSRKGLVIALILASLSLGITIYMLVSSYNVPLR